MRTDLADLLAAIDAYLRGEVDLDRLKWNINVAINLVTEYHRRALREKLLVGEARLDSIQFTTDTDNIFERTRPIVEDLRRAVAEDQAISE